jgi:ribose transport system substrate-binding protein
MKLMNIKRFALLVFLVVVCIVNSSCAVQEERLTIEIIASGTESAFLTTVCAGAQTAAEQYSVDIKLFGPELENNYRQQGHILRQSILRKPDAIIFTASDKTVEKEILDAEKSDITMIALNSGIDENRYEAYVGTDHRALGQAMAQEITARFSSGTIAVINDIAVSAAAKEREEGFLEIITENPAFSLLKTDYCDASTDTAEKLVANLLESAPDLTAIVCLGAQATAGACKAIEKVGRADVFLAGIDCADEEAWYIEGGILDVVICQNPYAMGYFSIEEAVRHIRGESSEKIIHTDFRVITKETMFQKENQELIFPIS